MPRLDGIDVSHHNGRPDWSATLDSGIDLVCVRATHGAERVDREFARSAAWLRSADRPRYRGWYHFVSGAPPADQLEHFANTVGPLQPGEFVMLDVEPDAPAGIGELPWEHVDDLARRASEWFGLAPLLYVGMFYPGREQLTKRWPWWLPAWRDRMPSVKPTPVVWQWSATQTVPGIGGPVDANEIVSRDALERLCVPRSTPEVPMAVRYVRGPGSFAVFAVQASGEVRWVSPEEAALLDVTHAGWRNGIEVVSPSLLEPFAGLVP